MLGYFIFCCFRRDVLQKHSVRTSITTATRAVSNAPDSFGQTSPVIFLATFFCVVFFPTICTTNRSRALVCCFPRSGLPGRLVLSARPASPRAKHTSKLPVKKTSDGVGTVTYFRAIISHNMTEKLPPSLKSNQSAPAPISSSDAHTNRQVERKNTHTHTRPCSAVTRQNICASSSFK